MPNQYLSHILPATSVSWSRYIYWTRIQMIAISQFTNSSWVHDKMHVKTLFHYDDVIMDWIASQITSLPVVCSIVYSGVNQRKHQSSASLAFVREIHRGPVNFPHKWPVTRKMFPFDDVIMCYIILIPMIQAIVFVKNNYIFVCILI